MTRLDLDALECALRDAIRVVERPDGALLLRTGFEFPDGDRFPIHLQPLPSGGVRLSDRGHTVMHLSHDHEVDALFTGSQGALLDQIVGECAIEREGGLFYLDTTVEELPEAVFRFGQALTRIYDLGQRPPREHPNPGARRSTRRDAL